jgi:hypothetical protein
MQERRARAEQAWRAAHECVLTCAAAARAACTEKLRQCSGTVHRAAELCLELPEHSQTQLELRAALDELVGAIESGNDQRLASALDRSWHAGSALGWRVVHTGLH